MAQAGCRINIRLYHDKSNMRTFKKFAIEEFPIFKEVIAAKMCLIDTYQNEFRGKLSVETLELGYVGYSNAKHKITNEKGLEVGYESKKHHKDNCPLFYIAEIQKPSIDTSKRKATSIKVGESQFILCIWNFIQIHINKHHSLYKCLLCRFFIEWGRCWKNTKT